MGETGVGKTAIITYLCKAMNAYSDQFSPILNIHAGITEEEIISFVREHNK
jgi:hypothetical protein